MKARPLNILLFIMTFAAAAGVTRGVDANVDKNKMYAVRDMYQYEDSRKNMTKIVEKLKNDIEEEKTAIESFKNLGDSDYYSRMKYINKQIKELKFYNGFTDVAGPGIMLRVSDSTFKDESIDIMDKIVHDVDITVLLNDLKSAGAEAIEVNGKRIINISEVVCAGPLLRINGEGVAAPFVIRAIGDQEKLYDVVTAEGSYAYVLMKEYGMEVAVVASDYLVIPKYYGTNYEVEYATSIDKED
jgi:uncharacterized protein YlxW (UPF0749 family)